MLSGVPWLADCATPDAGFRHAGRATALSEIRMGRHKMLSWSSRRAAYLGVGLVAYCLTEIGRYVYRPFVYERGLHDFGFAARWETIWAQSRWSS